jgi:hypothetical protein
MTKLAGLNSVFAAWCEHVEFNETALCDSSRCFQVLTHMIRVTRETHEAPAEVEELVRRAGGLNWLGEPNFRVVWGGSRLAWVGGKWTHRDASGNATRECVELRQIPKYLPTDRWHVERWMAPEAYGSPEIWRAQTVETDGGIAVAALGPYPSRGEYEHCFTLQSANGEFIPLSPAACDWIVRAVEWARRQPRAIRRGALVGREVRREREWDRKANEILDGVLSS